MASGCDATSGRMAPASSCRAVAGTPHFDTQVLALHEAVLLEALDDPTSLPGDRLVSHSGEQEADAPSLSRLFGASRSVARTRRAARQHRARASRRVRRVASRYSPDFPVCLHTHQDSIPMVNGSSMRIPMRH